MSQEKVRQLTGFMASLFSHIGHITKEDAQKISGLSEKEFEAAYQKASGIGDRIVSKEGKKMDAFMEHLAQEIEEYFRHYGGKILE